MRQVQVVVAEVRCSYPGRLTKKPSPSSIRRGHRKAGERLLVLHAGDRCPHAALGAAGQFAAARVSASRAKFAEPSAHLVREQLGHLLPESTLLMLLG